MSENYTLDDDWYFQWNNLWYPVMPANEELGKTNPSFWEDHGIVKPIDLTKVCKPHDTITKSNIENSYAYYDPDTNYLYLPIKLLPEWLSHIRGEKVTSDEARLALDGMRFSKRYLGRATKYIYRQVKFERCTPRVSHTCRCLILDLSMPSNEYHITTEDMAKAMDNVIRGEWFPSEVASKLLKTESESKTVPTPVAIGNTKKAENAFKNHCIRKGLNEEELDEAMNRYRRGERLPRGRKPIDSGLTVAREAALVQEELKILVAELSYEGALYGPTLSKCSPKYREPCENKSLPKVFHQYLDGPNMFFTHSDKARLPERDNIQAWALIFRQVKWSPVTDDDDKGPWYQAYEIQELAIPLELLNTRAPHLKFRKAKTFVGIRRCIHPTLHIHVQCAVFNNNPKPKVRGKTKTQFYNDKIIELIQRHQDQAFALEALQERVSTLEEVLSIQNTNPHS